MRRYLTSALILLSLLLSLAAVSQEPPYPHSRPEWLKGLYTLHSPLTRDDYLFLNQFQSLSSGVMYDLLQEAWKGMTSEEGKEHILYYGTIGRHNTSLFPIIHLGRTDPSLLVRTAAFQRLRFYTFSSYEDDAEYREWYRAEANLPVSEVMRRSCQRLVTRLQHSTEPQRVRLLQPLLEFPLTTSPAFSGVPKQNTHANVIDIRRNTILESPLLPLLFDYLSPPTLRPLKSTALTCIAHLSLDTARLQPYEARLRPLVPLLLESSEIEFSEKIALLSACRTEWAVAPLLQLAAEGAGQEVMGDTIRGLLAIRNGRTFPMLIALEEFAREGVEEERESEVSQELSKMFEVNGAHWTTAQWREWWYNNRKDYSEAFARQPFPRLEVSEQKTMTVYRRVCLPVTMEGEVKPAYCYVSSGLIVSRSAYQPTPVKARPGLIVVIEKPDGAVVSQAGRWQETLEEVTHGGYVAVLISQDNLRSERVRAIVKDIMAHVPIDPAKVWLQGAGVLGKVAYTLSLEEKTPFRGFWMKEVPFQLSAIRGLKSAQKRRYLLQHDVHSRTPALQTLVAQDRLKSAGATVQLSSLEAALTARQLQDALAWLEGQEGKPQP